MNGAGRGRRLARGWSLAALVLLAASAAACGPLYSADAGFPRNAPIGVQPPSSYMPGLDAAMRYWNDLAGRVLFTYDAHGPIRPRVATNGDALVCGGDAMACAAPLDAKGEFRAPPGYPYSSCVVYVTPGAVASAEVIAHELGHCLGFDHVTDRPSVMGSPPVFAPEQDAVLLHDGGY